MKEEACSKRNLITFYITGEEGASWCYKSEEIQRDDDVCFREEAASDVSSRHEISP